MGGGDRCVCPVALTLLRFFRDSKFSSFHASLLRKTSCGSVSKSQILYALSCNTHVPRLGSSEGLINLLEVMQFISELV